MPQAATARCNAGSGLGAAPVWADSGQHPGCASHEPDTFASPPRALPATDLSARCDRALDRALPLARQCQARLVRDHVRDHPVDLVVIGSQGRDALSEILLGSVVNRILETVETDTLLMQAHPA